MKGMPADWGTVWSKLEGRFSRPHHRASAVAESTQHPAAVDGANNTAQHPPLQPAQAPTNSVTGLNYLPAARQ
eukprot:6199661-Pleurochrysis_carterae.AAC.1